MILSTYCGNIQNSVLITIAAVYATAKISNKMKCNKFSS